jgi:hypothetical protein
MSNDVKVLDLTRVAEPGESVAIIFFEQLEGTVHVYRDGTVMLSSPTGTTVTSLRQPSGELWRKTQFMHILAQLGATQQELGTAERMIDTEEQRLQALPFAVAVEQLAAASNQHFQDWCQQQGVDYANLDEPALEHLIEKAVAEVRSQ